MGETNAARRATAVRGGAIAETSPCHRVNGLQTASEGKRMNRKGRMSEILLVTSLLLATPGAMEGQLTPPAGPNDAASARFTLTDIWLRLLSGTPGTKRGGAFAEPGTGPATALSKTTDEIMAAAPAADNVLGATAAEVRLGKTFWGLRTTGGTWGVTVGTAPPASLAKTGQTQCYKYDGSAWVLDTGCVTNTPPNQDGRLQKGVAWPNPRFTKIGNGTVKDNLTGLIWLENANCFGSQVWGDAMNSARNLASGACGLSDGSTAGFWRLPNIREMSSLVDFGYTFPALSNAAGTGKWVAGDPFTLVQGAYWSSTSYANITSDAWWVSLTTGGDFYNTKVGTNYVWPVRDGQ